MQTVDYSALSVTPRRASVPKTILLAVALLLAAIAGSAVCTAIFGQNSGIGSGSLDVFLAIGIAGWLFRILRSRLAQQKVDMALFAKQNGWHYTEAANGPELVDFMSKMGFQGRPKAEFLLEGSVADAPFRLFMVMRTRSGGGGALPAIDYHTVLCTRQLLPAQPQLPSDMERGTAEGWNYVVYNANVITPEAMKHVLSVLVPA